MKRARSILRIIKRLADRSLGTRVDELYWKSRHLFDKKWAEGYVSEDSINNPHRKFLIDKISTYYPFESILEIGCASGPNLYLLATKFPEVKIYGTDISKKAIEDGGFFFERKNIKNIFLDSKEAEDLEIFHSKSIDIIFTNAALIYVGRDKINSVIKEILRVAKRNVILCEWHTDSPRSFYLDHWAHNYRLLFAKFIPDHNIKITKIPGGLWGGSWKKMGYIVEVAL